MRFERKANRAGRERVENISLQWASKLIGIARDKFIGKVSFKLPENIRRARQATATRMEAKLTRHPENLVKNPKKK